MSSMSHVELCETLPGASHWSMVVRQGVALRLTDLDGDANVGMLMHNPANPLERLNLPDTLKCQHTFKLTAGHCLYSDMGRIFCSIVHDDLGWHDAAGGTCNEGLVAQKWGVQEYQSARNDFYRNGRDSFLIELAKYGLSRRDLCGNVNWFSQVQVGGAGELNLVRGHSQPGSSLTLRFEMDTLVSLHTCAHPLNDDPAYPRRPVCVELGLAPPVADDDLCMNSRPENLRGFKNTRLYQLGAHF